MTHYKSKNKTFDFIDSQINPERQSDSKNKKREIIPMKLRKRRYLTDNEIILIKELRAKNYSYREIAKMLKTSHTVVMYHTNPEIKEKMILRNKRNLTKEQSISAKRRYEERIKTIRGACYTGIVYRLNNIPKINKLYEHSGLKMTLKDWSKHLKIPYSTLYARLWRGQKIFK